MEHLFKDQFKFKVCEEIIENGDIPNTIPEQPIEDLYELLFIGKLLHDDDNEILEDGETGYNLVLKNPRTGKLFFTNNIDWV